MKRTILALFVVTLLVAGAAFGIARWLRCRSCTSPTVTVNLHDTAWLALELKLTAAQSTQLAQLEADYQKRIGECCADHCAARADLAESLADPAKAADCSTRMCDAQNDSEKATLNHILRVLTLLTPDQQTHYTALVQQQLTGACLMRVQPARN
jgi:Spy/CpxP family protein refolding chaperone